MDKPPVVIVPYDAEWPRRFEAEAALIQGKIGSHLEALEHVGSTAIPGLASKPILDIMPGVRDLTVAKVCVKPLASIGYTYVPEHEREMPERRYFRKGPREGRTHHLHMVRVDSEFWQRHLLFRDYLRSHDERAQEYMALKRRLARELGSDREAYTNAKTAFIEAVVEQARREQVQETS